MPKVSIVIPVYNIENYVRRAIESACNQDYRDIEIIVINDGSTDGSLAVIDELAAKDSRIRVFSQENGGPDQARNRGLMEAKGEWIWFLDGDDYLMEDAVTRMLEASDGCDMVVCNTKRQFETHTEGPLFNLPSEKEVNKDDRIAKYFLGTIELAEFTDNKFYRREFIMNSGVRYESRKNIFAEDSLFLAKLLKTMGKIGIVDEVFVIYYQREDSETNSIKSNLAERCEKFMSEISEWYDHRYDFEMKTRAFRFFYDIIYNDVNEGYNVFKTAVSNEYFRKTIKGMNQDSLTQKQKLIVKLLNHPMVLYSIIRKRGRNTGKSKDELPEDILTNQTRELAESIRLLDRKNMLKYARNTLFVQSFTKHKRRIISFALVVFVVMLIVNSVFLSKEQTMIMRCNYSEAAKGFYPDGTWFDIFAVKSDNVLSKVIEDNNVTDTSISALKDRIAVFAINDDDIISRAVSANTDGKDFYYITNEYSVTYNQKNKFAKNHAYDMLSYISEAFSDIFFENYTENDAILYFNREDVDFDELEYVEIGDWFTTEIESIQQYITKRVDENGYYRSDTTGQTFPNIQKMIQTFNTNTLESYKGYVSQSGLTKDKSEYLSKLDYKNDILEQDKKKQQLAHDFRVGAIDLYDSYITGVAFIPSIDSDSQFYMNRTKTGIDYLTSDAYNYGVAAENYERVIQSNNTIINNVTTKSASGAEYAAQKKIADSMINDMCSELERISEIAVTTEEEYVNYKTLNYLEFIIPENTLIDRLSPFTALAIAVLAAAAVTLFMWFEAMISARIAVLRKFEQAEEEAEQDE